MTNSTSEGIDNNKKLIEKLQQELSEKENEIESLQRALSKSQDLLVEIHQSIPLRVFRKYDTSMGKILPIRVKKRLKSLQKKRTKFDSRIIEKLKTKPTLKDIIYFPMIGWDYRLQRSHHLLFNFAKKGHRVFYFTPVLYDIKNSYAISQQHENIYEIHLSSPKFFDIYKDKLEKKLLESSFEAFKKLKTEINIDGNIVVQFPTWYPLVKKIKDSFGFKLIYDCVDEIQSFPNINKQIKKDEKNLLESSDLTITSSNLLFEKIKNTSSQTILVPNAGDFAHFSKKPKDKLLSEISHPLVGYFGAIAEWFDVDLIEFLSKKKPECSFVFIGDTYGSNLNKIKNLDNIYFLGERPYSELPKYLKDFDICIIPFRITPLTKASNPIKFYEYLASGKPVVSTNLPELLPLKDLCYMAETKSEFLKKLEQAVSENDASLTAKRIEFASKNTWEHRFEVIYNQLEQMNCIKT